MDFKALLDKKNVRYECAKWFGNKERLMTCGKYSVPVSGSYLNVRDIGEWAWKEGLSSIKEHIEESKPRELVFEDFMQPNELDDFGIDYFSIALACLGKVEIKNRLEVLK